MTWIYSVEKKNQAKFSDTCSVRADGLCIGCPRLVGWRLAGNSNMLEFFCTTLYSIFVTHLAPLSHAEINPFCNFCPIFLGPSPDVNVTSECPQSVQERHSRKCRSPSKGSRLLAFFGSIRHIFYSYRFPISEQSLSRLAGKCNSKEGQGEEKGGRRSKMSIEKKQ